MIIAIIDIGTNTTRLLVKDSEKNIELKRSIAITRLGEGIEKTGFLSDEAMGRTKLQVETYVQQAKSLGAITINIFATAGCRVSKNGPAFIESLKILDNVSAQIIEGDLEAQLSFSGAVSGFNFSDAVTESILPIAVVDIGGGSTEIAISSSTDPNICEAFVSIPIGSSRLTERYFLNDPPLPEELTNAIGDVRDSLSDAVIANPAIAGAKTFIGVAATFTTTAAVEIGLKEFNFEKLHGFILTRDMAEDVFRTLATENIETRKFNPGLEPDRADVIVGGICILVAIMRQFELKQITVSCTDLLDGLYKKLNEG